MEMHGGFGHARGPRGEAQQRDVVATRLDRLEAHRFVERDAIELGVMIGGAVETDHQLEEFAVLGAGDQFLRDARVAERERNFRLSTIFASSPARSIGIVLTTTAPALVAASQIAIIAGLFAERTSTRLPGFTP